MLPYSFRHLGVGYELEFARVGERWFAALFASSHEWPHILIAPSEEVAALYSETAIRAGYIAQAKWLVENDCFRPSEAGDTGLVQLYTEAA